MPTNTDGVQEQQGPLCRTCGQPRSSSAHTSYGAAIDHRFIAAPVVPSDERCGYPGCQHPRGSLYHAEGFTGRHDFVVEPAPPTHSQDAEGDGHWRVIARVVGTGGWRSYERTNVDGRVESHRLDESLALAIESAIRAPYEELVKAARAYREARRKNPSWVNFDELHAIDAIDRALESLGGRKDG